MKKAKKKLALFSLYDQENCTSYARQLIDLGWGIVATKETGDILKDAGIKAVTGVSEFLGIEDNYPFPPTLHPKMELVLTTDQDDRIDLVYDTTYPLAKGNDVGGHTLLALAAKGTRIVVADKQDMERVIDALKNNMNAITPSFRQELIDKAYARISRHYYSLTKLKGDESSLKVIPLKEGENPYQSPAYLWQTSDSDPLGLANFEQLSGNPPCFTNMADFDSILQIFCSVSEAFQKYYGKLPYIAIAAKHGNPCGFAIDWSSPGRAVRNALFGNPGAIWGGEIIVDFPITAGLAKNLLSSDERKEALGSSQWMLDLIIAPDFESEAIGILGKRGARKLFRNEALRRPSLPNGVSSRMVRGGVLRQPFPTYIVDLKAGAADFPLPDSAYVDSLLIAWATSWFSNHGGNEVAIAKERKLLSAGGGPSTIDACAMAVIRAKKSGHDVTGSVFVADAFFPFTDGPEELIKAGCIYGIVPEGGKNFKLVKKCFGKNKVKVFYLPERYRGFCRH